MAHSDSTTTSTTHTMTAIPTQTTKMPFQLQSPAPNGTTAMINLFTSITPEHQHSYVVPKPTLPTTGTEYAKEVLDRFAGKLVQEQNFRLEEQRRKRKRGDMNGTAVDDVLRIRKVHVEGFDVGQIWAQARRVIGALESDVERSLKQIELRGEESAIEPQDTDAIEVGAELDPEGVSRGEDSECGYSEDQGGSEMDGGSFSANEDGIAGGEVLNSDDGNENDEDHPHEQPTRLYTEDPHKLNDGFFSIEEFNKQTEFLEQAAAAAEPYADDASDVDEIDWDADPTSIPLSTVAKSVRLDTKPAEQKEEEDVDYIDEGESGGPTFGNMDLDAPEGDSEDAEDDESADESNNLVDNTNDVMYKDFFEPPPRKASKSERQSKYQDRQARKIENLRDEDIEADTERAIAHVRHDLFSDESEQENSLDVLSDVDPSDPRACPSAHKRKQSKIAEEIRRLEAASIAKRDWTLTGEVRAADRPLNSLLEEDLDFERTGKPVPVITAEVSEDMEALIKRRILAQEFDEVIRRRPDALSVPASTRRGAFELDDSKAQQSLAEIYEEEHVKNNNPDVYVSKADEMLRKDEKEIEILWKDLSAKLDALCSWHYKPKPPAPSLTVVGDVATIAMEDAQPTTASGVAGMDSMLAPQEVYKVGAEKSVNRREVVSRSGAPIAREEMSREQKLRRRRREKERIRKRGGVEIKAKPEGRKVKQKKTTVGDLKKGGVKVIDRRGQIRDVEGNKELAGRMASGGSGYKL